MPTAPPTIERDITTAVHRLRRAELDPTTTQREAFVRACGVARWAWNFGLRRCEEERAAGRKRPNAISLCKEVVRLKKAECAWLGETSKWVPAEALRDLEATWKRFFAARKAGQRYGRPRFKRKRDGVGSFRVYAATVKYDRVMIPRVGWVRLKERGYLPEGKELRATVTHRAGRWYVTVLAEIKPAPPKTAGEVLGVDLGIKTLATLSDGTTFANHRFLAQAERRMRLLSKAVSRKRKGSSNRRKAVRRLARLHQRIANCRRDALHKTSHAITKRAQTIVLEDLNVAGMVKNRRLAKALSDASMGELRRQLVYKAEARGVTVIAAGRFYPSSKTCSGCGEVKETLTLAERTFSCACGLTIDRDANAAINLRNLAAGSAVSACRLGSAGLGTFAQVKLPIGQEGEEVTS